METENQKGEARAAIFTGPAASIIEAVRAGHLRHLEFLMQFVTESRIVPLIYTFENGYLTWTHLDEDDSTVVPVYLTSEERILEWIGSVLAVGRTVVIMRDYEPDFIQDYARLDLCRRRRTFQLPPSTKPPERGSYKWVPFEQKKPRRRFSLCPSTPS